MLERLSAIAGPKARRIGAVAGVLALGLLSTSPAFAYWDRWHRWHGPCCAPAYGVVIGAPPPVVYAPPPPVYYAPPPPVVYAPAPVISLGVHIR